MIKNIIMVSLGGGAGSVLRYLVQRFLQTQSQSAFPTGTFLVNISGCLLIGLLWGWFSRSTQWNEDVKLLLMTGFCGGFTTFSAFTLESMGLLKENKIGIFFLYVTGSVILGLVATYAGLRMAK